ncbi:MAG: NAD(P)H-dependent oxidoreductase subunit E [Bacteroidales bacterium]|nr:NAD(P)H-dependent oxidoreductase subunit E [Bacteroidales bacterium]
MDVKIANTTQSILNKFPQKDKSNLIQILQAVQEKDSFLSPEAIGRISEHLRVSRSYIFGVATFYSQFKFNPPGRHSIRICLGTACHVQGGDFLLNAIKSELDISTGETTEDGKFDLDRVACLGCCALAPVVKIDNTIHSRMSVIKLKEILDGYE